MTHIFACEMSGLPGFEVLLAHTPPSLLTGYDKYTHPATRYASLAVRWLLGEALTRLGEDRMPTLCFHENGQPYLDNAKYYISFSHSREMLAVAIGDSPCGVDTENTSAARNPLALAKRYFAPKDYDKVAISDQPAVTYLEVFTKMEALVKQHGHLLLVDAPSHLGEILPEHQFQHTHPIAKAGLEVISAIGTPPFAFHYATFGAK